MNNALLEALNSGPWQANQQLGGLDEPLGAIAKARRKRKFMEASEAFNRPTGLSPETASIAQGIEDEERNRLIPITRTQYQVPNLSDGGYRSLDPEKTQQYGRSELFDHLRTREGISSPNKMRMIENDPEMRREMERRLTERALRQPEPEPLQYPPEERRLAAQKMLEQRAAEREAQGIPNTVPIDTAQRGMAEAARRAEIARRRELVMQKAQARRYERRIPYETALSMQMFGNDPRAYVEMMKARNAATLGQQKLGIMGREVDQAGELGRLRIAGEGEGREDLRNYRQGTLDTQGREIESRETMADRALEAEGIRWKVDQDLKREEIETGKRVTEAERIERVRDAAFSRATGMGYIGIAADDYVKRQVAEAVANPLFPAAAGQGVAPAGGGTEPPPPPAEPSALSQSAIQLAGLNQEPRATALGWKYNGPQDATSAAELGNALVDRYYQGSPLAPEDVAGMRPYYEAMVQADPNWNNIEPGSFTGSRFTNPSRGETFLKLLFGGGSDEAIKYYLENMRRDKLSNWTPSYDTETPLGGKLGDQIPGSPYRIKWGKSPLEVYQEALNLGK